MIILGVDPGLYSLGWAVVEQRKGRVLYIESGTLQLVKGAIQDKLATIYDTLDEIVGRHSPAFLAVETQFFSKNAHSTIALTMSRGAVLLLAGKRGLHVSEYAPSSAKKRVTGHGHATKATVMKMIPRLIDVPKFLECDDEADALLLALARAFETKEPLCTTT
ncbi:MAG: crossover junction endodeoxyribonuclease RuvC [Chlamydiae bacterium RIFCSPHIGHO2_12_FULL_49_11]|nr:MAG: crossover junction endodeoxyribonuclease RuvC [Chlamydiae bacterium RIFCSPHIGHO2_12_FULL_49_11]